MAVMTHHDDIPWHDAPLPRRLHRCTPWTVGVVRLGVPASADLLVVERCACGAIRGTRHRRWLERNSRRRPRT